MDYIANIENSEIDVSGIRTVLVQGDSSYPIIRFVLDPSLTGLSWRVRGTYLDTLIPVLSPEIIPVESESSVILDWSVSSDFTTYYGDMQLVVVGANGSGTVITKALGEVTIQRDYSIGTMAEITLNLFEQLMAQAATLLSTTAVKLDQSTPQTITGGIPKLASTRVIDENNEIVDKKFVDDSLVTHNANTSAHADKEKTSNKVTSISSASTDVQYPSAKCVYDAIAAQHAEKYTAVWDKVNAQCTRANSAAGITTTITNFCHRGTVNASRSNPFDSIYPWSARGVCNISIDLYMALASGASIRDCIVSWLGDPDFDYNHVNGVWVYTPEFWYTVQDIGTSRHYTVSPFVQPGYIYSPERIEGCCFGGVYTLTISGSSKSCLLPRPGMPGKNVAMSTLHTYAKNWGASIENIYGYSATDVLMIVEFATMNTQTAIGNGVSDLYRESSDTIRAAATASATVKVLTAAAANCIAGAIFDIGTTNGSASVGSFIIASTALDTDPTYTIVTLTTDGSTPASVTVTTAHMWSVHGLSNTVDASIGAGSGYIGTDGKCHAYYRGQVAHANLFRYILGAYRQTATGNIWIANSSAEADGYDALNTAVHKNTGLTLPQGAAGAEIGDYIGSLHLCPDVPAAPFFKSTGGSNANPVGDYCYVPTLATANTILFAGGRANYGANCGRFSGAWNALAATSAWYSAAVPVLKTPI